MLLVSYLNAAALDILADEERIWYGNCIVVVVVVVNVVVVDGRGGTALRSAS